MARLVHMELLLHRHSWGSLPNYEGSHYSRPTGRQIGTIQSFSSQTLSVLKTGFQGKYGEPDMCWINSLKHSKIIKIVYSLIFHFNRCIWFSCYIKNKCTLTELKTKCTLISLQTGSTFSFPYTCYMSPNSSVVKAMTGVHEAHLQQADTLWNFCNWYNPITKVTTTIQFHRFSNQKVISRTKWWYTVVRIIVRVR